MVSATYDQNGFVQFPAEGNGVKVVSTVEETEYGAVNKRVAIEVETGHVIAVEENPQDMNHMSVMQVFLANGSRIEQKNYPDHTIPNLRNVVQDHFDPYGGHIKQLVHENGFKNVQETDFVTQQKSYKPFS